MDVAYPTVGRIVLFHNWGILDPLPAIVVVAEENRYTIPFLHVFMHDGAQAVDNVAHKDEAVDGEPYWDWMPFQKGQAAKTEQLEKELRETVSAARAKNAARSGGEEAALKGIAEAADNGLSKLQRSTPSPEDGKR